MLRVNIIEKNIRAPCFELLGAHGHWYEQDFVSFQPFSSRLSTIPVNKMADAKLTNGKAVAP